MTELRDDFWDSAAESDVPEPPKPTFEGLPDGANVLVRTTNADDKATVQPTIKTFNRKDGSGSFFKLKAPFMVVGGDSKVTPKHIGSYLFKDFMVEKSTLEQLQANLERAQTAGNEAWEKRIEGEIKSHDKFPCAPELYNLILDTLAPEGENTQERWAAARVKLALAAGKADPPVTKEGCGGNTQLVYAAAFRQALMEEQFLVIGRTFTPKKKDGDQYDPQQTIGSIGSYTEAEAKRRKVKVIEKPQAGDDKF